MNPSLLLYRLVGFGALGLAGLGAVVPLLPTVPFVILAAWAFGKSSPALRQKLRDSPVFGPSLKAWEDHGCIPRRAKAAAVAGMAVSFLIVLAVSPTPWGPALAGGAMTLSAAFVLTRPSEPRTATSEEAKDG